MEGAHLAGVAPFQNPNPAQEATSVNVLAITDAIMGSKYAKITFTARVKPRPRWKPDPL